MSNVVEIGGEPKAVPVELEPDTRSPVQKLSENAYTDLHALAEEVESMQATITTNAEATAEGLGVVNHNADAMNSVINWLDEWSGQIERRLEALEEVAGLTSADPAEEVPNAVAFNEAVEAGLDAVA